MSSLRGIVMVNRGVALDKIIRCHAHCYMWLIIGGVLWMREEWT